MEALLLGYGPDGGGKPEVSGFASGFGTSGFGALVALKPPSVMLPEIPSRQAWGFVVPNAELQCKDPKTPTPTPWKASLCASVAAASLPPKPGSAEAVIGVVTPNALSQPGRR